MWKNVRILKDSNFLWKCFLFVLLESYVYLVLELIWFRLFFFYYLSISSRILFFVRVKTEIRVSFPLREEFPL